VGRLGGKEHPGGRKGLLGKKANQKEGEEEAGKEGEVEEIGKILKVKKKKEKETTKGVCIFNVILT